MGARMYRTALDLEVGDVVTTSYGTGPYEIETITAPYWFHRYPGDLFIHTVPMVSITCFDVGDVQRRDTDRSYINDIRRSGERWLMSGKDELFVQKPINRPPMQIDMFYSYPAMPPPYPFDPSVDYSKDAWKCDICNGDFNWTPPVRNDLPHGCPHCKHGRVVTRLHLVDDFSVSIYVQSLNRV